MISLNRSSVSTSSDFVYPIFHVQITVWKRYSDFRKLHQNLWQLHKKVCSQSELFPPFAKAKVFGKKNKANFHVFRLIIDSTPQMESSHVVCLCINIGRFDDSVVEERRQCSEDLLQFSANIPALYNSQDIQDFFKVLFKCKQRFNQS